MKVDTQDTNPNSVVGRMFANEVYDRTLFKAEMDSDAAIEILQHLHDLKDRKIVD